MVDDKLLHCSVSNMAVSSNFGGNIANSTRPLKVSRLKNSVWPTGVEASIGGVPPEELRINDRLILITSHSI